jgi:hypothetical protein
MIAAQLQVFAGGFRPPNGTEILGTLLVQMQGVTTQIGSSVAIPYGLNFAELVAFLRSAVFAAIAEQSNAKLTGDEPIQFFGLPAPEPVTVGESA